LIQPPFNCSSTYANPSNRCLGNANPVGARETQNTTSNTSLRILSRLAEFGPCRAGNLLCRRPGLVAGGKFDSAERSVGEPWWYRGYAQSS